MQPVNVSAAESFAVILHLELEQTILETDADLYPARIIHILKSMHNGILHNGLDQQPRNPDHR
ncbi:hypothetical protein D3C75_1233380 [compost metagenome]